VEEGGRTNLQRWAAAADMTANRAGLLLANDLASAERALRLTNDHELEAHLDDLVVFFVGDRASQLRRQIGIAVG
jgi:hypothetical protein